jgi:hypothetical protein
MAKKNDNSGTGVPALVALGTGLLLILIPEPTTTALGTAIVVGTLGIKAVTG